MAEDERRADAPERIGKMLAWLFIAALLALFLDGYLPRFFG